MPVLTLKMVDSALENKHFPNLDKKTGLMRWGSKHMYIHSKYMVVVVVGCMPLNSEPENG